MRRSRVRFLVAAPDPNSVGRRRYNVRDPARVVHVRRGLRRPTDCRPSVGYGIPGGRAEVPGPTHPSYDLNGVAWHRPQSLSFLGEPSEARVRVAVVFGGGELRPGGCVAVDLSGSSRTRVRSLAARGRLPPLEVRTGVCAGEATRLAARGEGRMPSRSVGWSAPGGADGVLCWFPMGASCLPASGARCVGSRAFRGGIAWVVRGNGGTSDTKCGMIGLYGTRKVG